MDAGDMGDEALVKREEFLFEQLGSRITAVGEEHAKVIGDITELKRLQRSLGHYRCRSWCRPWRDSAQ